MKKFHLELPRVCDRIPFVAYRAGEVEVGFGRHSITVGRWFISFM